MQLSLRKVAGDYILENKGEFPELDETTELFQYRWCTEAGGTIEKATTGNLFGYVRRMAQAGTFADTPSITALARAWNLELRIWIESDVRTRGQPTDGQWYVIRPPTSSSFLGRSKRARKANEKGPDSITWMTISSQH